MPVCEREYHHEMRQLRKVNMTTRNVYWLGFQGDAHQDSAVYVVRQPRTGCPALVYKQVIVPLPDG